MKQKETTSMKVRIKDTSLMFGERGWVVETFRWWFPFWITYQGKAFRERDDAIRVATRLKHPEVMAIQ